MISWAHLVAVVVWIGGWLFQLLVLLPVTTQENKLPSTVFTESAMRFRYYVWGAMAIVAGTGMARAQLLGGMGSLPPIVHTKVLIALIMIALGVLNTAVLLPKLHGGLVVYDHVAEAEQAQIRRALSGYALSAGFTVLLGLAILLLLAMASLV